MLFTRPADGGSAVRIAYRILRDADRAEDATQQL